ncbi:hypothetical protein [Nitrobacter hamburgensis]|nr:hypothetical protein [Nitrobacter hamburgensis]
MTLALALASGSALALEAATTGSQATQATVGVINSKVDTSIAALQSRLDKMEACEAQRKFYAPADPKKDSNGCVGVGDYDLNMASTSNVNLANGRVYSTNSASNNWGGLFYGPSNYGGVYGQAGIYGVYGNATGNGYGVIGNATADSGGIGGSFYGGNSGVRAYGAAYGVLGNATNGWAGYFTGTYGVVGISNGAGTWGVESYGYGSGAGSVYIGNDKGDARLCLNGSCTTSLPSAGYYTLISSGYRGSMSRTNSSGRGMMVMASGGLNSSCGGNYANPSNLNGYVNGNWVTYSNDNNIEMGKGSQLTFFVPPGSYYSVTSSPYGCGNGYFYVSEAVI